MDSGQPHAILTGTLQFQAAHSAQPALPALPAPGAPTDLNVAAQTSKLVSSVSSASAGILSSYRQGLLASQPDYKQLRSNTASTLMALQRDVLPYAVQDVQNVMRYLENFRFLKFDDFKADLDGIIVELKEYAAHAESTFNLCQHYKRFVITQKHDIDRKLVKLTQDALDADAKERVARQWGTVAKGAAIVATAVSVPAGVGAIAAQCARQLATAAALGMGGAVGFKSSSSLLKEADSCKQTAEQLGSATDSVKQHLQPALENLAEAARSLQSFFNDQMAKLGARETGMRKAAKTQRTKSAARQFMLMRGMACEMLEECRAFQRQCMEAACHLERVIEVARDAGELQPRLFQDYVLTHHTPARVQALLKNKHSRPHLTLLDL